MATTMAGMHVHDVAPPARDHIMPPAGEIDFAVFKAGLRHDTIVVLEPAPGLPAAEIAQARRHLATAWSAE
jgi:hypothetical protein